MPGRNLPLERDGDAEKAVAFAVLAFTGFEEPSEVSRALPIGQRSKLLSYLRDGRVPHRFFGHFHVSIRE